MAPNELNGHVKSVTIFRSELCAPEQFFRNYDETTEIYYPGEDMVPLEKHYYDKKGHLTKIDHFDCKGNGIMIQYTATYDRKGRKTKQVAFEEGLFITTVYAYDKAGRCIQETRYNELGDVYGLITYTYNSRGLRTDSIYRLPDWPKLMSHTIYTYDEQGFLTRMQLLDYSKDGECDTLDTYTYENDERGNPLKITNTWYLCEAPVTEEFTYNERGQVLIHTHGDVREEIRYHDTLGREYTRTLYLDGREIGHITYIYDWRTMNWDMRSFAYTDEEGKSHIFAEWLQKVEYY